MKKLILILLTGLCMLQYTEIAAQKPKKGFVISGAIIGLDTGIVILTYGDMMNRKTDTAIVKKGIFEFTGTVDNPTFSTIRTPRFRLSHDQYIENTKMSLTGNLNDPLSIKLEGSETEKEFSVFNAKLNTLSDKTQKLFLEVLKLQKTDSAAYKREFKEKLEPLYALKKEMIFNYIKEHPASWLSLNYLSNMRTALDIKMLEKLFNDFDISIKQSKLGKEIAQTIAGKIKSDVGSPAMMFTMADVNNKAVNLNSFKGSYVLLDFWASWCGPCRAENPALIKVYQKFKDKGFHIVGISVDDKKDKWLSAIKSDGLEWTNLSDLQGLKNEAFVKYGISSLPTNFLINPQGIIIAKNLKGADLDKKLEQLLRNTQPGK